VARKAAGWAAARKAASPSDPPAYLELAKAPVVRCGAFAPERSDMSDTDWTMDSGEEDIDEEGRNPTQQQLDEESSPPEVENEPSPHQGEEGTEPV
jgi:hypothetical protein